MSKAGMLGLLEGAGDGIQMVGKGMVQNALLEAQEKRQMNLLNIQRQWGKEDKVEDRAYQAGVKEEDRVWAASQKAGDREYAKGEKIDDRLYNEVSEESKHVRNRGEALEDQETAFTNSMKVAKFGVENREPSAEDKKIARLDKMLASGDITQEEYKNNLLGLSKTAGFTQKDKADAWEGAYKQAAKERESDMKFQELPAAEQQKALNARADELVQRFTGSSGGGAAQEKRIPVAEKVIAEDARTFAKLPTEKQETAITLLKNKGYSDDDVKALLTKSADHIKKNQESAANQEAESKLQQARSRVTMAQASGQQPRPEDLALITPAEEKVLSPADRIRQKRRDSWSQQNKGQQIPDDILNKGLLQ